MPQKSQHSAFKMPSKVHITGRTSTITNSFVQAIIPQIEPSDEEITLVLEVLGMSDTGTECSYCGAEATQWDHLNAIVRNKRPTGYITNIANLVPACGTCNQSKGAKHWKIWMLGTAAQSPSSRRIPDIETRVERLTAFESIFETERINFEAVVDPKLWDEYWAEHENVVESMKKAQNKADQVWESIQVNIRTR
ncbi:MAG: HNH endonuclease [Chloroflexi bacterium]|jgi:hypothetical protein|nr:HNH endonuclease [Chloroflexota bacterium]